jgi:foldase protein PrsA
VALCVVVFLAPVVAGCGGGVSGGAVATVDGESIEKKSFEHWMAVAAKSSGRPNAQVPKPPDFVKCVEQARKGKPKATDGRLRQQCKQEYEALRDQTLQLLISSRWVEGEASERGISVTDSAVEDAFKQQKKQSFPKDGDYKRFLRDSGQTEDDVLQRVRLELLSSKIREQVTKGKDRVTDRQVAEYFKANRARFARPERRDLRLVLTKTAAKAERAKAALAGGAPWTSVARRYSIDPGSRAKGGKLADVAKGQQERSLDAALFAAGKGKLTGPVKTTHGYYVFDVTKVVPGSQQTLKQAEPMARQLLAAENQQKALKRFIDDFRRKWRARTACREGYEFRDCNETDQ